MINHKEIIEQIARERKREFDRVAKRYFYGLSENWYFSKFSCHKSFNINI
jgi:hypothetical protein